jgi:hypothetical protein
MKVISPILLMSTIYPNLGLIEEGIYVMINFLNYSQKDMLKLIVQEVIFDIS